MSQFFSESQILIAIHNLFGGVELFPVNNLTDLFLVNKEVPGFRIRWETTFNCDEVQNCLSSMISQIKKRS